MPTIYKLHVHTNTQAKLSLARAEGRDNKIEHLTAFTLLLSDTSHENDYASKT